MTDPRTLLVEQQYDKLMNYIMEQTPLGERIQHDPTLRVLINAVAHAMVDDRLLVIKEVKELLGFKFRGGLSGTDRGGVTDDPNGEPPVR